MIANYKADGWEIVSQRNHALLAAQLCGHWKISDRPTRWIETLVAVAEHDDVFDEFERGPLVTESGGPLDFKMTNFDLAASKRLIDMALSKSSFIALLVARQISFTHGEEAAAKSFLKNLQRKETEWMKSAAANKSTVLSCYELLEFCDALSLLICQGLMPPEERKIEIGTGPNGKSYQLAQTENRLIVTPWPFEYPEFAIFYEQRLISILKFKSDAHFRRELRKAKVSRVELVICKA